MGISSPVRLAASRPAARATSSTGPLGPCAASTRASTPFGNTIRARAIAERAVTGFCETSTMRAEAPLEARFRWLKVRGARRVLDVLGFIENATL